MMKTCFGSALVTRPERLCWAGTDTMTRPSASVWWMVTVAARILSEKHRRLWSMCFFSCRRRVSWLSVCRPAAEPGAFHRLQRSGGLADLEQHLRGELLQVNTPVSRLCFGLIMYIRYIRFLTVPYRPFTIRRPLIPNVLHSSAGNDGRTVVTCGHDSLMFRVWFLNERSVRFYHSKDLPQLAGR